MAHKIKIRTTFYYVSNISNFIYIEKIYYHVIRYYLICIALTTLYRIRLLIITYAEKIHIAKLKLTILSFKVPVLALNKVVVAAELSYKSCSSCITCCASYKVLIMSSSFVNHQIPV